MQKVYTIENVCYYFCDIEQVVGIQIQCTKSYVGREYLMDYKVQFTKQAEKDLDKIRRGSKKTFENISVHLLALKKYPTPQTPGNPLKVQELQGRNGFRIRVGQYRILYTVNENKILVEVFRVGPRGDVYKK